MRSLLLAFALTTGTAAAPAQGTEWVTNGSFTGSLAPWVLGGAYSVNPGFEPAFDTTGMGPSDCYGVNAGGQVTPSPYPPNWIEQQILVIQGLTYEFRADACGSRFANPNVANADIGTIWVEVDSVEVARHAFGNYVVGFTKRAQLCGRFSPTTTGLVTLRIYFQRAFLGGAVNPRMNLDNVTVKDVAGPTFWHAGNRKIGTSVTAKLRGTPGALFATFVALGEVPAGIPFPGIGGALLLDPASATTLAIGNLDVNGVSDVVTPIPNNTLFTTVPLFYQAAGWDPGGINFGFHFGIVATL